MNQNSIRLARLLTMLPWLTQQNSVSTKEISRIFDISEKEVFADLALLTFVGPDQAGGGLVDIQYTRDQVRVIDPQGLNTPLTLSNFEILTLLMGLKTLEELEVANPSTITAIEKLTRLTTNNTDRSEINSSIDKAISEYRLLEIVHISQDKGMLSQRVIEPQNIVVDGSNLYLLAWCQASEDFRKFRIDRIISAKLLDRTFTPRDEMDTSTTPSYVVKVTLDAAAIWVLEQYQVSYRRDKNSSIEIELQVYSLSWLSHFLTACAFWIQSFEADQDLKFKIRESLKSTIERLS
jgi:proteasome accessory factor C